MSGISFRVLGCPARLILETSRGAETFRKKSSRTWEGPNVVLSLRKRSRGDGSVLLDIEAKPKSGDTLTVRRFEIALAIPSISVHRFWVYPFGYHGQQMSRSSYVWWLREQSCANSGVPVILAYSRDGRNRGMLAFVDQVRDTEIRHDTTHHHAGKDDETINRMWLYLRRPITGGQIRARSYREQVCVDLSPRPYYEVIDAYRALVDEECDMRLARVPEGCLEPLWCSWYAFRLDYDHRQIVENARIAKELGFATVLMDGHRVVKGKFPGGDVYPDAPKTTEAIHRLGLRSVLWMSPLIVTQGMVWHGKYKKLIGVGEGGAPLRYLCPRARETAAAVADITSTAMRRSNLDGLKLDFLEMPKFGECKGGPHRHHYDTVGEGMDACMRAMYEAITAVNPDASIEYRQNYANLLSRQYANCLRDDDSPYDFDHIREQTSCLRPLAKGMPVHADYAYWHRGESINTKAIFMACVMYGCVPTVSVDLRKCSAEERELIKNWLSFYASHKYSLVFGKFVPLSFEPHCSVSRIEGDGTTIFGLFSPVAPGVLDVSNRSEEIVMINGTNGSTLNTWLRAVEPEGLAGRFSLQVFDPLLRPLSHLELPAYGSLALRTEVEPGGIAVLRRSA